jgi:hypothetical protein
MKSVIAAILILAAPVAHAETCRDVAIRQISSVPQNPRSQWEMQNNRARLISYRKQFDACRIQIGECDGVTGKCKTPPDVDYTQ